MQVVDEDVQGEALGALNGIKALTEGVGPLLFGLLMALYEHTPEPGAPYVLAALLSFWAFLHCFELPIEPVDAFVAFSRSQARRSMYIEGQGLLDADDGDSDLDSIDDYRLVL